MPTATYHKKHRTVQSQVPGRTICKSKAIIQLDPDELTFVDASRCYGCHLCITTCTDEAIVLDRQ